MAAPTSPRETPSYELRAPVSGAGILDPRSALLIWGGGSIVIGVLVSILLVQNEIRSLTLLLLGVMGLLCLSIRRGVYILTVFLPFMYAVRRAVLYFQAFESRDPILLFPAVTVAAMFLGVLIFYAPRMFRYFKHSRALKALVVLMGIFAIQMINPLQGSLFVGIAGGMFFIVPMLWCGFGLLLRREDMDRIFKIVILIGLITAVYGLKQHYLGLTATEEYELRAKNFYKVIGVSENVRVMSTFASAGDFSLYMMVAASLAFAFVSANRRRLHYALCFLIDIFAMLWLAVRSSFLIMLFSMMTFTILKGNDKRRIVVRTLMGLFGIVVLYAVLYSYDPTQMYDQNFSTNAYVVHTLSGITHPTQEASFQGRLENWARIVVDAFIRNPIGHGLGSTTVAASKFEGGIPFEADSFFFEMFYGSSILAPIAFIVLVLSVLRTALGLSIKHRDFLTYRMAAGLLAGLFLGSVFGSAARDTITGPLLWLVVGWVIKEDVDARLLPAEETG
jgi:hypothetical protein